MKAWVSRRTMDPSKTNARGEPKRAFQQLPPGVKGINAGDAFVVFFRTPEGKLKQEAIDLTGKPGKRLADDKAAQLASQLTLGSYEERKLTSWPDFLAMFERRHLQAGLLGGRSAHEYRESLKLFAKLMRPGSVEHLGPAVVDEFRAKLAKQRGKKVGSLMSVASINKHLRALRTALNKAEEWGLLAKRIKVKLSPEPQRMPRFMTEADFGRIYQACDVAQRPAGLPFPAAAWWRAILTAAYMTGMRRGELLGLRWADVSLDEGAAQLHADSTKGKRDELVPLHAVVVEHLRQIQDYGELVFWWDHDLKQLDVEFRRIQAAAGIKLECRAEHQHTDACHAYKFHDMRRACGTLNAARLSEKALGAFMRHASPLTTKKFYLNSRSIASEAVANSFVPAALRPKEQPGP